MIEKQFMLKGQEYNDNFLKLQAGLVWNKTVIKTNPLFDGILHT